jgi:hypothetical protein
MAVIEGGVSGLLAEVGLGAALGQHVTAKPIPHGSLGHYRVIHTCILPNAQAANSRLFVLRNPTTNIVIPTRMVIGWQSASAHTAILHQYLDVFKLTAFTTLDTTNTVTLTGSVKRTSGMAAAPGGAQVRGVTVAGAAAGMTGFANTKDTNPLFTMSMIEAIAVMAATETISRYPQVREVFDDTQGTHPLVLAQNEGIVLEERTVEAAAGGSVVTIDLSWCETTAY